jgi:hypothetical protein
VPESLSLQVHMPSSMSQQQAFGRFPESTQARIGKPLHPTT